MAVPLILFLAFSNLVNVQAQAPTGDIVVQQNEARPGFPVDVRFALKAQGAAKIDRVQLIYGVTSDSCLNSQARQEIKVETPGEQVDLNWRWDLSRGNNMPPGVEIWWQWEIHEQSGAATTTEIKKLKIEDPHFPWKQFTSGSITLYWADGGYDFGAKLMNIAERSLARLAQNAGLTPDGNIRMMIYPDAEYMKEALVRISDWAGGVAFPEYNVVMIGIPNGEDQWAEDVIPHELAHLVTDMRVFNCQENELPHWFNEGLADYAEGPIPDKERTLVLNALEADTLQPLTSLALGFPGDTNKANLAYRQSRMVVTYLIETQGAEKLDALFDHIQSGEQANAALRSVYGLDTAGLDQAWRASLGFGEAPQASFATATPAQNTTAQPTFALFSPFDTPSPTPAPATATPIPSPTEPPANPTADPQPSATADATPTPAHAPTQPPMPWLLIGGGAAALTALIAFFVIKAAHNPKN